MLGVAMTCSCFDRSTAETEFAPLYEEMNRRGTVLNYHQAPSQHPDLPDEDIDMILNHKAQRLLGLEYFAVQCPRIYPKTGQSD